MTTKTLTKFVFFSFCILATFSNTTFASHNEDLNGVRFTKKESKEVEKKIIDANKVIFRYPSFNRVMEMNRMIVNGRSPVNEEHFIYNSVVHFLIYVTKGTGVFYVDSAFYQIKEGDVLDVPPKTRFAVSGTSLEYVTIENPAWFPEQFSIVDSTGNVVDSSSN